MNPIEYRTNMANTVYFVALPKNLWNSDVIPLSSPFKNSQID